MDPRSLYNRVEYQDKNVLLSNVTKYQHSYYGNLLLRLANSKGKIDNIDDFMTSWRKHFIENNDCKYLPLDWSVENEEI